MKSKSLYIIISFLLITLSSIAQKSGTFTDKRDGKIYKTVQIGKQTWMAENLAYKAESGCVEYDHNQAIVKTYGYLYKWETAKNVCPEGWHLPSNAEWTTLTDFLGGEDVAGGKLKSTKVWGKPNTGADNSSGFTALPGGYYYLDDDDEMTFDFIGNYGNWWSSTELSESSAYSRGMSFKHSEAVSGFDNKKDSYSVRCISDK